MNPYGRHTDGCDSEYKSIVDSVINCSISEGDFSKIRRAETEADKNKPSNS